MAKLSAEKSTLEASCGLTGSRDALVGPVRLTLVLPQAGTADDFSVIFQQSDTESADYQRSRTATGPIGAGSLVLDAPEVIELRYPSINPRSRGFRSVAFVGDPMSRQRAGDGWLRPAGMRR